MRERLGKREGETERVRIPNVYTHDRSKNSDWDDDWDKPRRGKDKDDDWDMPKKKKDDEWDMPKKKKNTDDDWDMPKKKKNTDDDDWDAPKG